MARPIVFQADDWKVIDGTAETRNGVLIIDHAGAPYWVASKTPIPENFLLTMSFKIDVLQGSQRLQRSQLNLLRALYLRFGAERIEEDIYNREGLSMTLSHTWMTLSRDGSTVKGDRRGNTAAPAVLSFLKRGKQVVVRLNGRTLMEHELKNANLGSRKFCIGGFLSRMYLGKVTVIPLAPLGDADLKAAPDPRKPPLRSTKPVPTKPVPTKPAIETASIPGFRPLDLDHPKIPAAPRVIIPLPPAVSGPKDIQGDPLPYGAVARIGSVRLRHESTVRKVQFSPDGRSLASYSAGMIVVWDVANRGPLRRFKHDRCTGMDFSPDGKQLAASSREGVKIWDLITGKELARLGNPRYTASTPAFSPNGKFIAWHEANDVLVWNLREKTVVNKLENSPHAHSVVFSPDSTRIAAPTFTRGARIWDFQADQASVNLQPPRPTGFGSLKWSPSGKFVTGVAGQQACV
ncbi:MAG: hypothetical protein N2C14_23610, partial [Planctomycetales bacterium]